MGLSDAHAGQRFPVPAADAWTHLKRVAPSIGRVKDEDDFLMRLNISTGASLMTWGENLTVSVKPVTEQACNVVVGATAKADAIIGVVGHMAANSRNAKHVDAIISALSASLRAGR